jgi:hypothetical protein
MPAQGATAVNKKIVDEIRFEKLEDRVCLSVSATMPVPGLLQVSGQAEGLVQILESSEADALDTSLQVRDDGQLAGSFSGVEQIRILLDMLPGAASDDHVQIHLGPQSLDKVFAFLGQGNNTFEVSGNFSANHIIFVGGFDNDTMRVDVSTDDLVIEREPAPAIVAMFRDGHDQLIVDGHSGWLFVEGGPGNDHLSIGSTSVVSGISARLGSGNNRVDLQGRILGNAGLTGAAGNDTFNVHDTATIGGNLIMRLGDGSNTVNLNGSIARHVYVRGGQGMQDINVDSTWIGGNTSVILGNGIHSEADVEGGTIRLQGNLNGNVFIRTGNDPDTILVDAAIAGDLVAQLGAGDNRFFQSGSIGGNLLVESMNGNDPFDVFGTFGGKLWLNPGGQSE